MASSLSSGLSSMGLSNNLSSRVEIGIECRNLPRLDAMSKSDPMVVLFLKENTTGKWQEIGRTEMIRDNENPNFIRRITMDYYFEEMQELRFDVFDIDKDPNARDLSGNDYIGSLTAPLSTLIAANHRARNLMNRSNQAAMNKGKPSQIIIHCEEIKANSFSLHLKISGKKLDKKDLFGKSDPYVQIYKQRSDGSSAASASSSWQLEYQSETIMKTLDPNWKEIILPLSSLCNGDLTRPLLFKVFDYDSPTSSDRIGEFDTCIAELLGGLPAESYARFLPNYEKQLERAAKFNAPVKQFTLRKPDKKDHKDRERSRGTIIVEKALLVLEPTFLDFIQGGMQVNLMVAVDFTGSNGHPRDHGSLHFIGPTMNQYQQAISSVGSILAPYDSDQRFPVYGFGGSIRGTVNHCFPLTFDPNNPEVFGVEGLLSAYSHAINQVELSGPTYFTPMIDAAAAIASSRPFSAHSQSYHILLLLTDGVFNDMESTIDALVNAADKPLSIIIVGVGNADFSAMKILDGDEKPLESNGRRISRDIVQFVAFRDFGGKHISALTKETLAEIPKQVLEFAKMFGVAPMSPPPASYYAAPSAPASAAAAPYAYASAPAAI